jgi:hypothetical protein
MNTSISVIMDGPKSSCIQKPKKGFKGRRNSFDTRLAEASAELLQEWHFMCLHNAEET